MLTVNEICQRAQQIPCSPSVVPKALDLLNQDNASVDDLEQLILVDPGLTSAILKMANSAFFGPGQAIDHISDAIFRLGFQQTYRLVVSVAGGRWSTFYISAYGWEPGDFCRHSFAVAVASRLVSDACGFEAPDVAYTAGMMHDAGKLALAFAAEDILIQVREHQEEKDTFWLESEQAVLGFTHLDITSHLLHGWHFPENLVAVGQYYAVPREAPEALRKLVQIIHTGKHLAIMSGVGVGLDSFHTPVDEDAVAELGFSEEDLHQLMPRIIEQLDRLLQKQMLTGEIKFN